MLHKMVIYKKKTLQNKIKDCKPFLKFVYCYHFQTRKNKCIQNKVDTTLALSIYIPLRGSDAISWMEVPLRKSYAFVDDFLVTIIVAQPIVNFVMLLELENKGKANFHLIVQ